MVVMVVVVGGGVKDLTWATFFPEVFWRLRRLPFCCEFNGPFSFPPDSSFRPLLEPLPSCRCAPNSPSTCSDWAHPKATGVSRVATCHALVVMPSWLKVQTLDQSMNVVAALTRMIRGDLMLRAYVQQL